MDIFPWFFPENVRCAQSYKKPEKYYDLAVKYLTDKNLLFIICGIIR